MKSFFIYIVFAERSNEIVCMPSETNVENEEKYIKEKRLGKTYFSKRKESEKEGEVNEKL